MGEVGTRFTDMTLGEFSRALASAEPVPGGGSACAIAASLAASLTEMVAGLSRDRPRYAAYERTHVRALDLAAAARERLLRLADEDAVAFTVLSQARRMPKDSLVEQTARDAAVRAASRHATDVPLDTVRECHTLIDLVDSLAGRSNLNASSDLEVAALLVAAAARGAAANVVVNVPLLGDQRLEEVLLTEVEARLHEIGSSASRIQGQVRSGNLRSPEPA